MTPDFCIPMKTGECMNACPVKCAEGDLVCPGEVDDMGCKMPDFCFSGDACPAPGGGGSSCEDKWSSKKCQKRKNKGKCNKKKVKNNCQKTCEFCGKDEKAGRIEMEEDEFFDDLFEDEEYLY